MSDPITPTGFRFGLPPSLGRSGVRALARDFALLLHEAGFGSVIPMANYGELEAALSSGEIDAAWGPPLVCARAEAAGGSVLFRACRAGDTRYRSVVLCHKHFSMDIPRLKSHAFGSLQAGWVDEYSMAGFILPRHHLRKCGAAPEEVFEQELMLGSYEACMTALLEGEIDVTAMFAQLKDSQQSNEYLKLAGKWANRLHCIAHTDSCPNDGLLLSPALPEEKREPLSRLLGQLFSTAAPLKLLYRLFNAEHFDVPQPGTYQWLLTMTDLGRATS